MANALITQQVGAVCNQALGLLHESVMLPNLLYRNLGVGGGIAVGDTVNVPVPPSFTAQLFDREDGIVIQDITNRKIPVVLDQVWDVSVGLTAEELTMDLTSFGEQVTDPAMIAIAEKAEALGVALLESGGTGNGLVGISATPASTILDWNEAVARLNARRVPRSRRWAVVGTSLAAALKNSPNLLEADKSGSPAALREGIIGRLGGVEVYENSYVSANKGYICAYDCAVLALRALETMGHSFASTSTFESVAMRTVIDYNITLKQQVASFDVLTGGKVLDERRIVKVELGGTDVAVSGSYVPGEALA